MLIDHFKPKKTHVYHKTDFNSIRRQLLLSNWTENLMIQNQSKSVEELWNSFKSEIYEIQNKVVPKQLNGIPSWETNGSMPINQVLRDAIRNKSKLNRRWISSKNVSNVSHAENVPQAYTKARKKVKAMIHKSKGEFERNIGIQLKSNLKIFWSHVCSKLKTKTSVAPCLQGEKDENSTKFDEKEKSNFLQKQFVSVFTKQQNARVYFLDKKTEVNLPNINITEELLRNEILKLNVNKSCGPDEMHPQILIELVDLASKPLALLLNKSMGEECILQDWKMTYVSLIFEKGTKNNADNCRPISLMSIMCKLIDSLVKNMIMTHMRAENLLSSKQYDFINGRFTTI